MRLRFWTWLHGKVEDLWEWIYFERMVPLGALPIKGRSCWDEPITSLETPKDFSGACD